LSILPVLINAMQVRCAFGPVKAVSANVANAPNQLGGERAAVVVA